MPVLETPLFDYLTTALAAEVDDRIYPKRAPEGSVLPYITYERVSSQRSYTHDPFPDEMAWVRARVSFACVAQTMLGAIDIGEALVEALSGYHGDMEGLDVGKADVLTEFERYDEQTKLYRRIVDVLIDYQDVPVSS